VQKPGERETSSGSEQMRRITQTIVSHAEQGKVIPSRRAHNSK